MLTAILGLLGGPVAKIIDKVVPDKDMAQKLKHEIQIEAITNRHEIEKVAGDIILAEAKSEHWLTANWRPLLMLVAITIVANNYIIAPYANAIFGSSVSLDLDQNIWDLLKIGVGGYVVGRSGEKIAKVMKQ